MKRITVKIDGMMCGMCEAHICDTIGEAAFLSENDVDEEALKKAIADTGYTFVSVLSEEYKKRGLFGR